MAKGSLPGSGWCSPSQYDLFSVLCMLIRGICASSFGLPRKTPSQSRVLAYDMGWRVGEQIEGQRGGKVGEDVVSHQTTSNP